jgi:ABC-type multidrug transport system permease subunit
MAKPAVSVGCAVLLSPGAAGPPDSGIITTIVQTNLLAGGLPLAVSGSLCQMINTLSGVPYMLPIGSIGSSTTLTISAQGLVRMGDQIPSGPGILTIIGPPASPAFLDSGPP